MIATDGLAISGLHSGYGSIPVIRNVNLEVSHGEVVALVGRNGVGKTTLIKTIVGLLRATGGCISYLGKDITRLDPSRRAKLGLGYIPQGRGIFARLSVEENLRMGELVGTENGLHQNRSSNYELVFDLFPILKRRRTQKGGALSGGEQQMLAIGRVLLGNPSLLLLDEPSEGIQPSIVHDFGRIIRTLRDQACLTVLLVEQNWDLVRLAADRCQVMDKGEIVATLSAEEMGDVKTAVRYLAI
jgi:branched-chain amino acid transport system ATP-binding protein